MRIGRIKRWDKVGLLLTLLLSLGALAMFLASWGKPGAAKWLTTFGQLLTIAGVFQLEVSGLFDRVMDTFSDEKEYPYGPPSHIMREIYNDPDQSVSMLVESLLFFRPRTGFWLIVLGTAAQIWGTWL
jgi:hypothetical protein